MKEYKIDKHGDVVTGIQYTVSVYSGKSALCFLIDTGAMSNLVLDRALPRCSYTETGASRAVRGINGTGLFPKKSRIVQMDFCLDKPAESQEDYPFNMSFFVATPKQEKELCKHNALDGVLGIEFLQNCVLNLAENRLVCMWDV